MKIDTHTHIWNNLKFPDMSKRYTPNYIFSQKDLENIMNKYNIEKAVLVQPSFLGNDNSLIGETLKNNPNKYRGVIVLDDFDSYSNLTSVLINYNEIGVKGIRFNLIGKKLPNFNENRYQELFSIITKLNWHLEIHANEDDICTLFKNYHNYNLKIVLDHFARPKKEQYSDEFISLLKSGLNFYIKVSANYRFNDFKIDNFIKTLYSSIGIKKLLWGSDCPFTRFEHRWDYQKSIDLLMKNKLTYNFSEIFDNNAKELFGWE